MKTFRYESQPDGTWKADEIDEQIVPGHPMYELMQAAFSLSAANGGEPVVAHRLTKEDKIDSEGIQLLYSKGLDDGAGI